MSNEKKLEVKTNQDIFKPDRGGRAEIAKILAKNPSGDFSESVTDGFRKVFFELFQLRNFANEYPHLLELVLDRIMRNNAIFSAVFATLEKLSVFLDANKDPKYLEMIVNHRMLNNSDDLKRLITSNSQLDYFRTRLTEYPELLASFDESNKLYIDDLFENQSQISQTSQASRTSWTSRTSRRASEASLRDFRPPKPRRGSMPSSGPSTPRLNRASDFSGFLSPIPEPGDAAKQLAALEREAQIADAEAKRDEALIRRDENAIRLLKAQAERAEAEAKARFAPTIVSQNLSYSHEGAADSKPRNLGDRKNSQPLSMSFTKRALLAPNILPAQNTFFSVRRASDSAVSLLFSRLNEESDSSLAKKEVLQSNSLPVNR